MNIFNIMKQFLRYLDVRITSKLGIPYLNYLDVINKVISTI